MGLEDIFPVAEHHVPRMHVPAARMDAWKEVAQDEIMRALASRHSWYNAFKDRVRDGFDMIADRPQLKAFVRPVPNTSDKDILIRSTLEGVQLDELVAGMYCDTTYDVRCAFAHLYEANFLDGAILQAYETRTHEDPMHFVGVRWICFRSPAPAIMTSRDFLFFSYEGTAYDVDGERVLFRFLRSMPMDDIAIDKSNLPPLVTGKISNLHFYRQNGSRVDAFTKAMHSNAGNMPAWVVTKTISFMFPGIANVETICDARALLANGTAKLNPGRLKPLLAGPVSLSPSPSSSLTRASHISPLGHHHLHHHVNAAQVLASANACGVCFHKFKFTRAKRRCQGCIREVCKRCTKRMFFFDELKHISDTGVVALRFCLNCTRQARADVREANAHRVSFSTRRSSSGSATSVSSFSHQYLPHANPHAHHQQSVRRASSAHRRGYQPEGEPPYGDSTTSSDLYEQDESDDDDSVEYDGYNVHALTTAAAAVAGQVYHRQPQRCTPKASTLEPHQIQQLHRLQQQRQYDPQDHEEFLRLYGEYAARHDRQQRQGTLTSVDQLSRQQQQQQPSPHHGVAASPPPFHRKISGSSAGSGGGSRGRAVRSHTTTPTQSPMHIMPELGARHMLRPMPQPDVSPRSLMIPLSTTAGRANSAPTLPVHLHSDTSTVENPRASLPPPRPPLNESASPASEDLETIFRLRMLLFNEADSETMSTTSSTTSSSHHHKPLVPQLVQRY